MACPWGDDRIDLDDTFVAITKDLSDLDIGLIVDHEFPFAEITLAFWMPSGQQPWCFHGCVRRSDPIGGGFWVVGVELLEVLQNHSLRCAPASAPAVSEHREITWRGRRDLFCSEGIGQSN